VSCPTSCLRLSKAAFLLVFLPQLGQAASPSEEDLFFKDVSEVSDGDLRFLLTAPDRQVHHQRNRITLNRDSLKTGWVQLDQCHQYLDAVATSQIVFSKNRIRNLQVVRSENIERAWVVGNTVQMENIQHEALLCLSTESRALSSDAPGSYVLRNGPYQRRFLDGFYPMRVSNSVNLGDSGLKFVSMEPPAQPGFNLHLGANEMGFDTWFEGKLVTNIRFAPVARQP
jgi:hypothetical protein